VNFLLLLRSALVFLFVALTVLLSGCVVRDGGYYEEDVGAAYYEPYGVYYGDWGPGYEVAPYHDRDHHREGDHHEIREGGHAERAYKSAPVSRSIPSIPSRSRSGEGRSR
jgi:hypothetical protein